MTQLWFIHAMKCHSTLKGNQVLVHAKAWMNLENMPSERSQPQKTTYSWFHLYEMSRIGQFLEIERLVVATEYGRGEWD